MANSKAQFHYETEDEFKRLVSLAGEQGVLQFIIDELNKDDVVWDIGAHMGTHTCLFAGAVPDGEIISFEPNPAHADRLTRNVQLNGFHHVNIERTALADVNETAELSIAGEELDVGRNSLSRVSSDGVDKVEVEVKQGDKLAGSTVPAPSVIKIDVEGAELAVIDGLQRSLHEVRLIVCEVHVSRGVDSDEVSNALESYGFDVSTLETRGEDLFLVGKQ